nr:hypothetical protein [uncultured Bacteroides sp.]
MKDIDEYRLGNLVIFENESTKAIIVKVTQIEYVNNTIYSLQINNCNWISRKEIKPVQLFIDSLVDLKFYINSDYKKDNLGNIVKVDYIEDIYHYSKGSLELKIHKSDDTIWYKKKQIHYIHQLQNLCTDITGEPFTISEFYESHFTKSFFEYSSF